MSLLSLLGNRESRVFIIRDQQTLQKNLLTGANLGETKTEYGQKPSLASQIKGGLLGTDEILKTLTGSGIPFNSALNYLKNTFGIDSEQVKQAEALAEKYQNEIPREDWNIPENNLRDGLGIADIYAPGVDYTGDYGENFSLA